MSETVPQLRLYNTLTRSKEAFTPIDAANVRMYVCGPTVYDYAHIGNARPVIVFDVLYRLLRHLYGEQHVTYVRNITDVDDKINARAARDFPGLALNEAIRAVTQKTADQFEADALALGCLKPTHEPRATENIAGMIDIIGKLLANGAAYVATGSEGREVLFSIAKMADYGQLSRRKLEDQQAGARVAVEAHKRHPGDFVLWKESTPEEPGWDSPWGRGRPGWHIECSAMSRRYLGETFDIHGGGLDLIFPHHENEIAQSRCAFGHDVMANVWMHNGFLQVEGQKMSKSLGNFVTISELLHTPKFGGLHWDGRVVRLAMLGAHYRQPIDWTEKRLLDAASTLLRYKTWAARIPASREIYPPFLEALCDDLNIPQAIASLYGLIAEFSGQSATNNPIVRIDANYEQKLDMFVNSLRLLGIDELARYHSGADPELSDADRVSAESLVRARLAARAAKNWAESDRIRDELAAMGIVPKDNKDGTTTWEVKR